MEHQEKNKSVKEHHATSQKPIVVVEKNRNLSVRGSVLTGLVVSAKAPKTVTVERIITKYVPKYERYKKTKSKVKAHNPDSIGAKEGDIVTIGETRKLSRTKSFVVIEIVKRATL